MTVLDDIVTGKRIEVAACKTRLAELQSTGNRLTQTDADCKETAQLLEINQIISKSSNVKSPSSSPKSKIFESSLLRNCTPGKQLSVIAEIKRKSPSKGSIAAITDPADLAGRYTSAGAAAISCLTEKEYFGGSIDDLKCVSEVAKECNNTPTLRKDFIFDEFQIAEAVYGGASAVLLIVAILGREGLQRMILCCDKYDMEYLVEIHDEEELKIAIDLKVPIIGVNCRNLKTFVTDLTVAERLAPLIPHGVTRIAESGIHCPKDADRMLRAGYHGVLVGESLVKSEHTQDTLHSYQCPSSQ